MRLQSAGSIVRSLRPRRRFGRFLVFVIGGLANNVGNGGVLSGRVSDHLTARCRSRGSSVAIRSAGNSDLDDMSVLRLRC